MSAENHEHHIWVKQDVFDHQGRVTVWWKCINCDRVPTIVKPGKKREDRPLGTICPGAILYADKDENEV